MPATALIAALVAGGAAAASGLFIAGAIAWATVATAAIGAAVAAGAAYLLQPKVKVGSAGNVRTTLRQAIAPARYVFGYARVSGVLHFARLRPGDDKTIDIVVGITEGDLETVHAIFVGGEYVSATKASETTDAGGRVQHFVGKDEFTDQFEAWVYMDTTTDAICRENGASLRERHGTAWRYDEALPICWAHIAMTSDLSDADREHEWRSPHEAIEFVVSGIRISWPGQAEPKWTRNAAAIRYYWMTHVRGRVVDRDTFASAYAICQEIVEDEAGPRIETGLDNLTVAQGSTGVIGVRLSAAPGKQIAVEIQAVTPYFTVDIDSMLFDDNNFDDVQQITVTPADDIADFDNAKGSVFIVSPHVSSRTVLVTVER